MSIQSKADNLAKSEGFDHAKHVGQWKDMDLYVADTDEECCVGLPQYILSDGKNVFWASDEQVLEIMASRSAQ